MMPESIIALIIGLILSYFTVRLSKQQGSFDLFSPPILVLVTMWLQYYLPALTLPYYDYWVYPHRFEKSQVILYPILLSSVGWLSFLSGYKVKLGRLISRVMPAPIPSRYTIWTAWTLILIGSAGIFMTIKQSGGLFNIAYIGSVSKGTGVWFHLGFLILPGVALMWSWHNTRVIAILASIVYFVVLMSAQARGASLVVFIILFIMSSYIWNLKSVNILLFGNFFVMFIIIAVSVGRYLIGIKSLSDIFSLTLTIIISYVNNVILTINRDLSRLEQLSIIMELVPEHVNYFLGIPMLQGLLGPFSKYLFPGTLDWRILLTSVALYGSPEHLEWGMGGAGVGEWYANFGLAGVIIGWLLFGVAGKCLYEWFQQGKQRYPQGVLLPMYVLLLWILEGCMMETFGHLFSIWLLVPVVMTSRWRHVKNDPLWTKDDRVISKTTKWLSGRK